jgi:glyoxylate utilization-related uncharacterized protein
MYFSYWSFFDVVSTYELGILYFTGLYHIWHYTNIPGDVTATQICIIARNISHFNKFQSTYFVTLTDGGDTPPKHEAGLQIVLFCVYVCVYVDLWTKPSVAAHSLMFFLLPNQNSILVLPFLTPTTSTDVLVSVTMYVQVLSNAKIIHNSISWSQKQYSCVWLVMASWK